MRQRPDRRLERGKFPPLVYFWGLLAVVFFGILVFAWVAADRANPVMLDEHGHPRGSETVR
jgi:hypothetical protein